MEAASSPRTQAAEQPTKIKPIKNDFTTFTRFGFCEPMPYQRQIMAIVPFL
jgi:hypothetical protein